MELKFWKELKNQRKFFDDLAHHLNLETRWDWYNVCSFIHEIAYVIGRSQSY